MEHRCIACGEKEQEILALRKLVREAAEMLEHVHQYGEDARISAYEIEAWMNRKWEVLPEYLEVGGKNDEEAESRESQS